MTGVDLNYGNLLKLLVDSAPIGAMKISFDYEVKVDDDDPEGGVSYYKFWLHDEKGGKVTYSIEKPIIGYQLGEECLKLKNTMFEKTGNKWKKISVEINFKEDKFNINYEY